MKIYLKKTKKSPASELLRIMKLITIFLFAIGLQVSAKGFAQQHLSIEMKNEKISNILLTIEKQSDYRFLYDNNLSAFNQKTSLSVQDADIKQVLSILLQNTSLSYQLMQNNLIVLSDGNSRQLQSTVTGKVVADSGGVVLSGVSVVIKGTKKGTTTNANGNFTINASSGDVLVFSYVGYDAQEITVGNNTEINISLAASKKELEQVVVIGYGTQKKRDLTGSITVVKGDDVAKLPSTNPISSLQGKVAGLTIVNSGQAGSSPTVRIRGVNSTNNAAPLYVVDGIQLTNIDFINPADIETIEVLKDPSSEAIYGLQGGNGVIIITTKRAKRGQTVINVQSNVGIQKVTHEIAVTNAAQFKQLYSEQLANGTGTFDFSRYDSAGGNTNWQDQIFRSAIISNNSLSISNSSEKTTTYLNLGYSNQQGVEKYDNFQKYIIRLNEEIRVTNSIKIGAELDGYFYKQNPPAPDIENEAIWAAPIIPVQTSSGIYYGTPSFQRAQVANPLAIVNESNGHTLNTGYRVTGNIFAEIKFLKNFTFRSTVYGDLGFFQQRVYSGLSYPSLYLGEVLNGQNVPTQIVNGVTAGTNVSQTQSNYKTFQQDHTLTFDKTFIGSHHLVVLAGFSTLYHYNETLSGNRTDTTLIVPNDPAFWYVSVIPVSNPTNLNGGQGEDASASFIGRINYTFKNRYLLNLTYRRDGTSKFAPDVHWGDFKSAGAGWVVSDENFMSNIKWLNFLKLRASWGTLGNGLGVDNYLPYPGLNNSSVAVFGNNIYAGITPAYIPSPTLHWETVEGTDAGLELRALKNRFNLDVDWYDRKTKDIITQLTIPNSTQYYVTNLGTIDNRGLEISAGWFDHITRNFTYSINGNFSINKNVVESIGNSFDFAITGFASNGQAINLTNTGNSIGYFYGYVQKGIYQSTGQTSKAPYIQGGFLPGDISYVDINGDDTINQKDRVNLGSPFPKYNFGISLSLAYKNFDLLIDGQGVSGNEIYVERRTYSFAQLNYEINRLGAWNGQGTSNTEPILNPLRSNNALFSDYWLESGNYFRFRTLQLGYTFILTKNQNKGIQVLRLYVSGQNLRTFTKASGYTPEVPIDNPISGGHDNNVYPVPAIYSFGVNLTL